jgi:hypothetical protein
VSNVPPKQWPERDAVTERLFGAVRTDMLFGHGLGSNPQSGSRQSVVTTGDSGFSSVFLRTVFPKTLDCP